MRKILFIFITFIATTSVNSSACKMTIFNDGSAQAYIHGTPKFLKDLSNDERLACQSEYAHNSIVLKKIEQGQQKHREIEQAKLNYERMKKKKEENRNILYMILFFILLILLVVMYETLIFKEISRSQLKNILKNTFNKTQALNEVKALLKSKGYTSEKTQENHILYKKYSFGFWHRDTVEINYSKLIPNMQREAQEAQEKKKMKEAQEIKNIKNNNQTPHQKALAVLQDGLIKIIILGVILSAMGGTIIPLIGLPIALVVVIFPIAWIYYSIKDSNTTHTIQDSVKTTIKDIKTKTKSTSMKDKADTLLKYHEMLEKGIISQAEFNTIKKELMG